MVFRSAFEYDGERTMISSVLCFFRVLAKLNLWGRRVARTCARNYNRNWERHCPHDMKPILFVCTRNASRSQMAEAFFNALNKNQEYAAQSAGIDPAREVNPLVVEAMRERGISMEGFYPKMLTEKMVAEAHAIVRLCGRDACVWAPEEKTEDWDIEDPKGKPIEKVREVRDIIEKKVRALLSSLGQ